jgi:hypothetical protein
MTILEMDTMSSIKTRAALFFLTMTPEGTGVNYMEAEDLTEPQWELPQYDDDQLEDPDEKTSSDVGCAEVAWRWHL